MQAIKKVTTICKGNSKYTNILKLKMIKITLNIEHNPEKASINTYVYNMQIFNVIYDQ